MNKELLDKLKFQAAAQASPLLEGSEWQQVYSEKFAELIVKECVAKTMEVGEQHDEPIEPIWVANCIAHRIFKHFGVEE